MELVQTNLSTVRGLDLHERLAGILTKTGDEMEH